MVIPNPHTYLNTNIQYHGNHKSPKIKFNLLLPHFLLAYYHNHLIFELARCKGIAQILSLLIFNLSYINISYYFSIS